MHAASFVLLVTCVLHQASASTPNATSSPQVELKRSEPRLDVLNHSGRFAEFRIRSSGGDRQWKKLRLKDEERASIAISTEESYDVQIWFYIYQDRWIVSCQNRIPIGSWIKADANGENRHHAFTQWLATPVDGKDGVTHRFDELGETRVSLGIGENITCLIVPPEHADKALPPPGEPGPFRLLGR